MNFTKTKNYGQIFLITIIISIIVVIATNPRVYMQSTFDGIMLWAKVVLPSLLPFFFFSKLLCQMPCMYDISGVFKKPMKLLYNTPSISGYIYLMSIISGYPVGAKLTNEFYKNKTITSNQAHRIISFCSTSGPLFIIGSVGVGLFGNKTLGLIIFVSHVIGSLFNGLIYRRYKLDTSNNDFVIPTISKNLLNDCMYNTIVSVMLVGGFISISYVMIDIINNLQLLTPMVNLLDKLMSNIAFGCGKSIINGLLEVTKGCVDLSTIGLSRNALAIISTGLISFGGISIHLQSLVFLNECNIKYRYFLLTKITHAIISMCVCAFITILF